ncbi:MAG: hypothetical protein FJ210_07595 [Betaproteobacteria bacterium]|nr:hypothetical protein [Betaproteobacteria bacterium]
MKNLFAVAGLMLVSVTAHAFPQYASGGFRGAELMTADEQSAHAKKLQEMQTYAECNVYMTQHRQEVDRRAAAKGVSLPAVRGNPCDVMRTFGRIK